MADEEKSLKWIVVVVIIGIVVFGWGFLAGSYVGTNSPKLSEMSADETDDVDARSLRSARRGAVAAFVGNALEQLPNLPAVISWHLSNRIWLPIMIVVLEGAALIGGFAMKKVESAVEKPKRRR